MENIEKALKYFEMAKASQKKYIHDLEKIENIENQFNILALDDNDETTPLKKLKLLKRKKYYPNVN